MDSKELHEKWLEVKQRLQKEHPEIPENDLVYEPGNEEEMLKLLQEKLNKTRHEIRGWLHFMG